jgi:hypothetical protein
MIQQKASPVLFVKAAQESFSSTERTNLYNENPPPPGFGTGRTKKKDFHREVEIWPPAIGGA